MSMQGRSYIAKVEYIVLINFKQGEEIKIINIKRLSFEIVAWNLMEKIIYKIVRKGSIHGIIKIQYALLLPKVRPN